MITLIVVGAPKHPWSDVVAEYEKRLSPYTRIKRIIIPDESFNTASEIEKVTKKEAEKIMPLLRSSVIVLLTPDGTPYTSEKFVKDFEMWQQQDTTIVIAGPLGAHELLRQKATHTCSLSSLTFTHTMALAVFLEQCYRSVMRQKGKYDY